MNSTVATVPIIPHYKRKSLWKKNLKPFYGEKKNNFFNARNRNKNINALVMKGFISQVTVHVCMLSHFSRVQLFVALCTIIHQAPLSMVLSRQEYWSGLPCPLPGDLPNPGIKLMSLPSTCTGRQVLYH